MTYIGLERFFFIAVVGINAALFCIQFNLFTTEQVFPKKRRMGNTGKI